MYLEFLPLVLALVMFAVSAVVAASTRGLGRPVLWFCLGLLFGPFGLLWALLARPPGRPCRYCREHVRDWALVCPHCTKDLADA
ncbi:MAG: hypothetical protein OXK78_18360 [Caldilineaceae bacterium]|nr:hypothetical protein [Caldilineaceae bacterium]